MSDPKRFGKFDIRGVLGRGGIGVIYLAIDPRSGVEVAIKEILPDPEASASDLEEMERRFRSELPEVGRLDHPHIVRVLEVGEGGDAPLIAMELVEGRTLDSHLRTIGRPSYPEILALGRQIAAALDHAHQQGVVHHDVRPGNVLVTADGDVKITDFGVARVVSADAARAGARLGIRAYLSPEQVRGQPVGPRSDQFSLAVMLYEMLTGTLPFEAEHASALLHKIANEEAEAPRDRERSLPREVDPLFARALSKDPAARFGSCGELVAELQTVLLGARPELGSFRAEIEAPEVSAAAIPDRSPAAPWSQAPGAVTRAPETLGERLRALYADHRRGVTVAAVALIAVLGIGLALLFAGGEEAADPALAAANPAVPPEPVSAASVYTLQVSAAVEGARIWVDGADTGLVTPAAVELRGETGEERRLELRQDGEVVAARAFVLGPDLPAEWGSEEAVAGEPRVFYVTSRPEGATLILDGTDSELTTPASVELVPERRYALRLTLEGHEPVAWTFSLDDLRPEQLESGRLHFPLRSTAAPASVVVTAGYPVTVFVEGDPRPPATRHELALAAGRHTLRLVAEEVFLRQTYTLDLSSGEQRTLTAPRAVSVDIASEPPGCEVTIDGIAAGTTPIASRAVVLGAHDFRFTWPDLGLSQERQESITRDGQSIFASAD